jgi:Ubiquitin-activating enzyme E1 FCCH domain
VSYNPGSQQQQAQQQIKNKQLAKAITGAVTHGGLIQITCVNHTFHTEDRVTITGVGGTVEANASNWRITVIGANTFDLQGSTFTNAYTSGGTAKRTQG